MACARPGGGGDIALWDLRGKLSGRPIANLVGGVQLGRIGFTDCYGFRLQGDGVAGEASVPDIVVACPPLRDTQGTTRFEGKFSDPDLRDALGPDAMLRIDSNQAFSLPSATYLAAVLWELGLRTWEA